MNGLVCFESGASTYAIPVERVREVTTSDGIRSLPDSLPGVVGLLESHDSAVTVLDTRSEDPAHIVVVQSHNKVFGLLVDRVTRVIRTTPEVRPAPEGQLAGLVCGSFRSDEDRTVLVLNADALDPSIAWPSELPAV